MRPTLVCLHGWGGSSESFTELREALRGADIDILTPDLPGFGEESEPPEPWGVDEYADWAEKWITKRVTPGRPLLLLGHSLGGQLAVRLGARGALPIRHLYLCAAAALRPRFALRRTVGYVLARAGKLILSLPGLRLLQPLLRRLLYKIMRVRDYERASLLMQRTMVRVTRQDLSADLPGIHIPTDIFWGSDDRQTPAAHAAILHDAIAGSRLHLYPGIRHRVHRDKAEEIANVIKAELA